MIASRFITYLPNYLIVMLISTLLLCLLISIKYIFYYLSEKGSFSDYIWYSLHDPEGSYIEILISFYTAFSVLATAVYFCASLTPN